MMNKKIALIGCGNMGTAIVKGLLSAQVFAPGNIMACTSRRLTADAVSDRFSIQATTSASDAAAFADILLLAVKPNKFAEIIPQIRETVSSETLIISIAAGQPLAKIQEAFGRPIRLIRAMPNTPAMVGASMSALCRNDAVTDEDMAVALQIFNSFGEAEVIDESLMDAVVGVSGSSPAYVYMFIEAMADAAVADGMPRTQALHFAAQSVAGAARMVLETGSHPGELKDAVCSPGGTTIEAVTVLEEKGLRSAVIEGQRACVRKSRDMSRQ